MFHQTPVNRSLEHAASHGARRAQRRAMLAAKISATMSGVATLGSPVASVRARRAASPLVTRPVQGSPVSACAIRTGRRFARASLPRASPSRARRAQGVFANATQDDGVASFAVPEDDSIQVRRMPGRTRSARPKLGRAFQPFPLT